MALLFDWFQRGGWLMWPLLAASILAVALAAERWLAQRGAWREGDGLQAALLRGWRGGGPAGLKHAAAAHGSLVAELAEAAIEAAPLGDPLALPALSTRCAELATRHHAPLRLLDGLAVAGPLLGLLGTMIGWAAVLEAMTRRGSADLTVIGADLAAALVTSIGGMIVGFESWLLYHLLAGRLERLEAAGARLVPVLLAIVRDDLTLPVPEPASEPEPAPEPEPEPEPLPAGPLDETTPLPPLPRFAADDEPEDRS